MTEYEQAFGILRFLRYVLALAAVLMLAGRSAWPQLPSPVLSVVWSPEGKRLATTDEGIAKVWDVETGQKMLTLSVRADGGGGVTWAGRIAWSPDGRRLATAAGYYGFGGVLDADTGQQLLTLSSYASSVAWSPDGKRLATSGDSTAKVWDAETGKELRP